MMKKSSLWLPSLLLLSVGTFATHSLLSQPSAAANTANRQEMRAEDLRPKEAALDFRGIAKKAIPAVVSIKVTKKNGSRFFNDNDDSDGQQNPYDFFNNDLFGLFGFQNRNLTPQPMTGQASGVIVSPTGYVLTNSHVVHGMDTILVQLTDGREFRAKVLGDDPNTDIALVKIDANDLPYLNLANSDDIEVGEWVAAIGNPFGLQASLTVGVVSAKSRNNLDVTHYEDFIQTDAAINRGNSGGPLVNLNGEVIGINTAIATNASAGYMGIGFAIPSNMAKYVIEEILSTGKISRGFLGVALQSIDYNLAQSFNLKKVEGALVSSVSKDSPAEKAGLKSEDIILKYNNHPVENAGTLRNAMYMMRPGTTVNLTVLRQDKIIQIPVQVGDYTENKVAAINPKNQLGIEVGNLTPELARAAGATSDDKGVVITKVNPQSMAAWAGLKKGALITSVNRQKVENVDQFNAALADTPKDRPVLLQIKQGERSIFVSLKSTQQNDSEP